MLLANFSDLVGGVAVAGADFAQVLPWHAVEAVNRLGVFPSGNEQLVEGLPFISPVKMEAEALPQLVFTDLAPPPLVENVLIASKDGLESQHDWTVAGQRTMLEQRSHEALASRQGMIVADQSDIGLLDLCMNLAEIENRRVGAISLAEIPQVLAPTVWIVGADFALNAFERVQLSRRASRS